jgi:tetratricopeptide (TPR) repeat protein
MLGHIAVARGANAQARKYYTQSLATYETVGARLTIGRVHSHLGDVALALYEHEVARTHHAQALASYQDFGFTWYVSPAAWGGCYGVPVSLQSLGDVALAMGDVDRARQRYREALEAANGQLFVELLLHLLLGPIKLFAREGNAERAVELAALARHHPEGIEETRDRAEALLRELRSALPPEAYAAAGARGQARDLEATVRELLVALEAR